MATEQQTFAYMTLWMKGKMSAMLDEFDESERTGIAASGSFAIKVDDIEKFAEYLMSLPEQNGYVRCDAAIFFAKEDKPGDLSGSIKTQYKKPETTDESPAARRRLS